MPLANLHLKALENVKEGEEEGGENKVDFLLQVSAIEVLGAIWPASNNSSSSSEISKLTLEDSTELIDAMFSCFSAGGAWTIRVAALKTLVYIYYSFLLFVFIIIIIVIFISL